MPETGRKSRLRCDAALLPPVSISAGRIDEASRHAQVRLLACYPTEPGSQVAIYAAIQGEVGTSLIAIAVRKAGGEVYYPRVTSGGEMSFYPVESESAMAIGLFGIPVPCIDPDRPGKREGFDLVVVPGLAFDGRGYRLGRGGGYYDRFLSKPVSRNVIGLAFSWQVVPEVPTDPWDVPVDAVVTEKAVFRVSVPITGPRACK